MYITMCLYITITILLWVLLIYPSIKHYTIFVSIITIPFTHMYYSVDILNHCVLQCLSSLRLNISKDSQATI